MNSMAKGKYKRKKNPSEIQQYKNFLEKDFDGISETYRSGDSLLTGSDEFSYDYDSKKDKKEKVAPKPISLVLKDWFHENWVSILILSILIPLFIWIVGSIIDIQKGRAVSEYRIEELEKDIEQLSEDVPNKEKLEIELENIKEDIDNINVGDLEKRIDDLENEVKYR